MKDNQRGSSICPDPFAPVRLSPVSVNGNSVARHIRRFSNGSTTIIGMSGTPWLLENEDFDMVLAKPFPLQQLIESIRRLPGSGSDPLPH